MGKEETKTDEKAQFRARSILKTLGELSPEVLEDISIGAEQELANREIADKGELVHIVDISEDIEKAYELWGKVSGISTGYPSLDAKIGGLKQGELILIAGETNSGKSALSQNIAVNVAKQSGVLFITLEMQKTEAGSRIKHMNGGRLDNLDLLFQAEYQIDYRHLDQLFKNAVEVGVKLVVLDYLQYMGRGMTLEEVAKMSKLMKSLALKYSLPFIVIVSLRKSDTGKFKRKWTDVEVEDLMGTSAIGYDADIALIASRRNLENEYDSDKFYVKVIKARNMPQNYDQRYLEFEWDNTRIIEHPYGWVPADKREEVVQLQYKD